MTTRGRLLATVGALAVPLVGAVVLARRRPYRIVLRRVTIPVPGGRLDAALALPPSGRARGLVVFVHGDGPDDVDSHGYYLPWWEAAATAGFASISWCKPGVGDSVVGDEDWQRQTMAERADEVGAVLDWLRDQPDIPRGPLGVWGISQAGFVAPAVAAAREDVDFAVLVAPAINWREQGLFELVQELDHSGASDAEREHLLAVREQNLALLEEDASFERYSAETIAGGPMDVGRWEFHRRNFRADATDDLRVMAGRRVRTFLMLGEHDRNVDSPLTAERYTELFGEDVEIRWFDAVHTMYRAGIRHKRPIRETVKRAWPRAVFAPRVFREYAAFLSRRG